ncbi:MAG: aminotransferase class V-fold PLP-dependent enzyme [Spirochaetaceae bacterium]|jgi:cysteine desulfurase family protein|nr:aminotransferase class V-fold PLP-dependent enzyme [Spirochaetaceae bacterium]
MIYANYAATSPALPPAAVKELCGYLADVHLNAARNFEGLEAGATALRARKAVAKLFNMKDPLKVIFTSGATASLNMAINGLVRRGDHVLATSVEHNAVSRPVEALRKNGVIEIDWLQCAPDGSLDPCIIRKAIKKNTRLLIMSHASNVLGTILPIKECLGIAREYGLFSILDTAQTAGVLPFTADDCPENKNIADIITFTGHKGLCALAGAGGFVITDSASQEMRPWITGGTGSVSQSLDMPDFLPDKFEPGTQNTIGILSLAVSIEDILRTGVDKIREHERHLTERFMSGLREIKKIKPYGTLDAGRSVALVSLTVQGRGAGDAARRLFEKHGIVTRSGLHCSPMAHKTAGTYPDGTVRFSFGRGTTEEDIDAALKALALL